MKKLFKIIIILSIITITISCEKNLDYEISSTNKLSPKESFEWYTSKEISLTIVGEKSINPKITNTLYVINNNDTILKKNINIYKDNDIKFNIEKNIDTVTLKLGSISKKISTKNNKINLFE